MKKQLVPKLRFKGFGDRLNFSILKELVTFKSGGTPSKDNPNFWDGEIPWISAASMVGKYYSKSERTITIEGLNNGSKLASKGSLLLLVRGSMLFNKIPIGIASKDVAFNQDVKALLTKGNTNSDFLYQWFSAKENLLLDKVVGTGIGAGKLDTEELKNLKISIPTLPEQTKIASFLSTIDEKIQHLTRKKELLEQYKKGVMQQLFSGKLRFKDENGKAFPKWEEKKLGDVLDLQHGYQFRSIDFTREGLAIIKISNVIGNNLYLQDLSYINPNRFEEFKRFEIHKGDILMSLTGNIGRVIEVESVPFKMIQNYRVGKFVPFDSKYLSRKFAKHLLMSDTVFGRFGQLANQSAQANFGKQDMDKIIVTIPNLPEQIKIATYLSKIDNKIESVNKQITQTQLFKKGLLQQMFV